jgi:putative transposase
MKEYQQRQEAIKLYLGGKKVTAIACLMRRSRKWVHHWIKRYTSDPNAPDWFKDASKRPKKVKRCFDEELVFKILQIRKYLENERMAQIGAISIQYEFERRGIKPIPAIWTINRAIARHEPNKSTGNSIVSPKRNTDYPDLFWHTHQLDLVGPRRIKGDGQFFSVNLIDTTTRSCFVRAVRTKSSEGIVGAIASFWQTHGMPDALQMDNELAFRGSNRYPRSFGSVIRFALSQNVAVVFIPTKEPWRNGIIEKFNNTYQQKFYQVKRYQSLDDLSAHEQRFIDYHNTHHRYSTLNHKTPDEMKALLLPPIYYKGIDHLPFYPAGSAVKIPLVAGSIYYIRYIRSDRTLYLPNETFKVKSELIYSYVVAEINIENHLMIIRQNGEIKQVFDYTIPAIDW